MENTHQEHDIEEAISLPFPFARQRFKVFSKRDWSRLVRDSRRIVNALATSTVSSANFVEAVKGALRFMGDPELIKQFKEKLPEHNFKTQIQQEAIEALKSASKIDHSSFAEELDRALGLQ